MFFIGSYIIPYRSDMVLSEGCTRFAYVSVLLWSDANRRGRISFDIIPYRSDMVLSVKRIALQELLKQFQRLLYFRYWFSHKFLFQRLEAIMATFYNQATLSYDYFKYYYR